jgi:hypothetical protein
MKVTSLARGFDANSHVAAARVKWRYSRTLKFWHIKGIKGKALLGAQPPGSMKCQTTKAKSI